MLPHGPLGSSTALPLPAIHLIFGLAKRWLLGTHYGAVSANHLQAYLDEYVFRFNRHTAMSPLLRPPDRAGRRHPAAHLSRHRSSSA